MICVIIEPLVYKLMMIEPVLIAIVASSQQPS
jgi:hypothetical protein